MKTLFNIKRKSFECSYKKISCTELDTLTMTKIECKNCEHYGDGVRLTGGIIDLGLRKFWYKYSQEIAMIISAIILILILTR